MTDSWTKTQKKNHRRRAKKRAQKCPTMDEPGTDVDVCYTCGCTSYESEAMAEDLYRYGKQKITDNINWRCPGTHYDHVVIPKGSFYSFCDRSILYHFRDDAERDSRQGHVVLKTNSGDYKIVKWKDVPRCYCGKLTFNTYDCAFDYTYYTKLSLTPYESEDCDYAWHLTSSY